MSDVTENAATPSPRPVIGRLPAYKAGKPPVVIPGLQPYKLSSNENPGTPVPSVAQAIKAYEDYNRYPDPLSTKLRNRLAEHFDIPAEDIVTGTGSLGALTQIINAFAGTNEDGTGDEVIYPWRSFEAYPIIVETAGATSVQVPLTEDHRIDLDAMVEAVTENTSVMILCTPNNPTGPVLRTAEVEDLLSKVPTNVLVVIDEAYLEYLRDDEAVNGLELYRKHPNVVALRTFSKAHSLANLRVGYSVSQPHITQYLRKVAVPFGVSSVAEAAAVASLDAIDEVLERVEETVQERNKVVAALTEQGWKIPETHANFVWLPLGGRAAQFAEAAGQKALSVRAFEGEGVRVSIGEPEANARFIELCAEFIEGNAGLKDDSSASN
ncbi:histidinol-phosphate transaminase [Pseudoglutamicibacter albus]|uniref:histidinol-phosphate transaminase n=1 Tax=Pseudoglutamicibacter albus TaxID=98671 RepID=UPI000691AC56|nr:histidinol-phosphate transaminase [Pseudoglutamicibacter albus]